MHRAMPPLSALRAFEAAARHLSLTKAAEELHVTPGALSHQIRGLEDLLGISLFERRVRAIALPPAARSGRSARRSAERSRACRQYVSGLHLKMAGAAAVPIQPGATRHRR